MEAATKKAAQARDIGMTGYAFVIALTGLTRAVLSVREILLEIEERRNL